MDHASRRRAFRPSPARATIGCAFGWPAVQKNTANRRIVRHSRIPFDTLWVGASWTRFRTRLAASSQNCWDATSARGDAIKARTAADKGGRLAASRKMATAIAEAKPSDSSSRQISACLRFPILLPLPCCPLERQPLSRGSRGSPPSESR